MARVRSIAALAAVTLALAACGPVTGPPATGAGSSSPDAVESAQGGKVGGGAAPGANGNIDPAAAKKLP